MPVIKIMVWNMEWMNDLFTSAHNLRDDNYVLPRMGVTVRERLDDLIGVIEDPLVSPDVVVVVEGPNVTEELQAFCGELSDSWIGHIQRTSGASQCIGVIVRTDTGKFDPVNPMTPIDSSQISAFKPFTHDIDGDGITENYHFERMPAYVEIKLAGGELFRVLGLHMKSKGIFSAYEWSKWWAVADANRRKLIAQARRVKNGFIDEYLLDAQTKDIPLIICGDINDGPGMDASEKRLLGSAVEDLMGNVWSPQFTLGNALFDSLSEKDRRNLKFEEISTTRYKDVIFNDVHHNVWIDHILYTRNKANWVHNGMVVKKMTGGQYIWRKFPTASDHQPVTAELHF